MFFFRREQGLKRKMARRIKSPRGSAYLQFALVLPLVVMVVSAMIEFTSFWDAKIMANHTAWTVGRIATVRAGLRTSSDKKLVSGKPSLSSFKSIKDADGAYVATAMLMSTCSMGSMHGSSADLAKDFAESLVNGVRDGIKKMVTDAIKEQLDELKNNFSEYVTSSLGLVDGKIGDVVGQAIGQAVEKVFGWLQDKLLKPLVEKLSDFVAKKVLALLPDSLYTDLGKLLDQNRQLRQIVYAIDRTARYDVVTVKERSDAGMVFSRNTTSGILDYPAVFDKNAKSDDWMVTQAGGWPPNGQFQKMIDVTIKWPFERAWLFPVLASAKPSSDPGDVPTAVGRALFYPQPAIFNENLASEGGKAYDQGDSKSYEEEIKKLKDQYAGFMNLVHFSYLYRLTEETVGPYDSESAFSGSYKGIGRGITGKAYKSAYHEKTGLVFWMDRAPAKTDEHSAWEEKSPPADYYACFRTLFGTGDETCLLFGASKERLGRLEYCRYHAYEWFYWGDGTTLHRRHLHGTPLKLYGQSVVSGADFLHDGRALTPATRLTGPLAFLREVQDSGLSPTVAYDDWKAFVQGNEAFAPCANAMTRMFCPNEAESLVARENAVWQGLFGGSYAAFPANPTNAPLQKTAQEITSLVKDCEQELKRLVGGTGGEVSYDDNDFFDFGGQDEDVLKDPEKTVKRMKEKLDAMKDVVFRDLKAVDKAETDVRAAYDDFVKTLKGAGETRRRQLRQWAARTAYAMAVAGVGARDVLAFLRQNPPSADYRSATAEIEAKFAAYKQALAALYEAELKMAQDLSLKSAQRRTKDGGVDTDMDKMDEIKGNTPKGSSEMSGSDNDELGDKWTKRESGGGWSPGSGGKEGN